MRSLRLSLALALFAAFIPSAPGVILLNSGDPTRNTSTPGNNSGWQYEGQFNSFLGTPIAPRYFITAAHIGGDIGGNFVFHGENFVTTAVFRDPSSDLQIWQVDHDFPIYAPLYTNSGGEPGQELTVHGRGTQRGGPVTLGNDPSLRGWYWGGSDGVQRWGRNVVTDLVYDGSTPYLQVNFDNPGLPSEAMLSVGDSGGGVFILQNGLWRLAAVNYGVDVVYPQAANDGMFRAIFDARGFYGDNGDGTFTYITGSNPVPTSFYSTAIAERLAWIQGVTHLDPTVLPTESFAAWQREYFIPAQVANATVSGPGADPDGDGVSNLLEYAFNLDPTYAEAAIMIADTGLRGLPLAGATQVNGEKRLTLEYVRRTAASGSGLTYTPQFTSGVDPNTKARLSNGTETVTPINARWERVKVVDTLTVTTNDRARFGRVIVIQNPAKAASAAQSNAKRR